LNKFKELIDSARRAALRDSEAYKKFIVSFRDHAKLFCQNLEAKDKNRDGQISLDTFLAALICKEMRPKRSELQEVFYIVCNERLELGYVNWVASLSAMYK
jgi:hypothetical protein